MQKLAPIFMKLKYYVFKPITLDLFPLPTAFRRITSEKVC